MTNHTFPLLSFIFKFVNILKNGTRNSLKKKIGRINPIKTLLILVSNLLKYFKPLLHEKSHLKY